MNISLFVTRFTLMYTVGTGFIVTLMLIYDEPLPLFSLPYICSILVRHTLSLGNSINYLTFSRVFQALKQNKI